MKITHVLAVVALMSLIGCGRPSAPDSPDPSTYGQTIQPFHQIPSGDQEGGGKPRSIEEQSSY